MKKDGCIIQPSDSRIVEDALTNFQTEKEAELLIYELINFYAFNFNCERIDMRNDEDRNFEHWAMIVENKFDDIDKQCVFLTALLRFYVDEVNYSWANGASRIFTQIFEVFNEKYKWVDTLIQDKISSSSSACDVVYMLGHIKGSEGRELFRKSYGKIFHRYLKQYKKPWERN